MHSDKLQAGRRGVPPFLYLDSAETGRMVMMQMEPEYILHEGERFEPLSKRISVIVGNGYTFNTDTILLAWFSMPKKGETCADFGTGCGTIPLLWCARSQPAAVCAVEIQPTACDMAWRSVAFNSLDETVQVMECDVRELDVRPDVTRGSFDLIACNPPYQAAGTGIVSAAEGERIARHETVCKFSEIAASAGALLRWGGRFCCCMRPERLCSTMLALREAGLEPKRLRFVQQKTSSAPFLFLLQANRGGRPGVKVEPVLLVEENGAFSEEMLRICGDYKGEKI
jgi:tRNA1Val (adenine37-N6)-methyltransferase